MKKERKEMACISDQSGLCKKKTLSQEHQNARMRIRYLHEYLLHTTHEVPLSPLWERQNYLAEPDSMKAISKWIKSPRILNLY